MLKGIPFRNRGVPVRDHIFPWAQLYCTLFTLCYRTSVLKPFFATPNSFSEFLKPPKKREKLPNFFSSPAISQAVFLVSGSIKAELDNGGGGGVAISLKDNNKYKIIFVLMNLLK